MVEKGSGLPKAGDAESPFIKDFILAPNPNSGQFTITIELAKTSPIALRIFDQSGSFIYSTPVLPTTKKYTLPMDLNLASGSYMVVLETAHETQIKRLIIF